MPLKQLTKPSYKRMKGIIKLIKNNPEHYDQNVWSTSGRHCFASLCVLKVHQKPFKKLNFYQCAHNVVCGIESLELYSEEKFGMGIINCANEYLGFTETSYPWQLYGPFKSLESIERFVETFKPQRRPKNV